MEARELIQLLTKAGWEEVSQKGSHRVFKHPDFDNNLSVPDHGARDLGTGLLHRLMKQAGLK
jgi:predicted RNA binding protein YcfA (HicA-like mRNA interferase family)